MTVIAISLIILLCLCLVLVFMLFKNNNMEPDISSRQSKVILDKIITLNTFPNLGDVIKWAVEKNIKRDYEGSL